VNSQRWEEIQARFDELVELNASDRAGRLAGFATTDPELHRALESLLDADAAATVELASIDASSAVAAASALSNDSSAR